MISPPQLVHYKTPQQYKAHYEEMYCRGTIFTFDQIRVYFRPQKFGHAFYESSDRSGKKDVFSRTRAERIDWIKVTLEHAQAQCYQGWNKDKKCYDPTRRVSTVFEDFVVVIQFAKQIKKAEFVTAYSAEYSIGSIKRSPRWV